MPKLTDDEIDELLELAYSVQTQADKLYDVIKDVLEGELFTIDFEFTELVAEINFLVDELERHSEESYWTRTEGEHPSSIDEMIKRGKAMKQIIAQADPIFPTVTQTGLPQVYVKSVKAEAKIKQINGAWGGFTIIRPK